MRVVLLGHRGLIGSAFASHLNMIGVDVLGIDRANYALHRGTPADVVINAAGNPSKRLADLEPLESFRSNVSDVLASVIDFPAAGPYLHISSVSVYNDLADPSRNHEGVEIDVQALPRYGYYKFLGESVVRRHTDRWIILRLGHVVGPGLKRNPIYDLLTTGRSYVHPDSTLSVIHSHDVARLAWELRSAEGHIFNVCGDGAVRLSAIAQVLGIAPPTDASGLPEEHLNINIEKLRARSRPPSSLSAVRRFAGEWRSVGAV